MKKFTLLFVLSAILVNGIFFVEKTHADSLDKNMLTYAVAWKQTSAEYKALYYQAFNIAQLRLDQAIEKHKANDKPLAIITDIDDTLFDATNYWGYLIDQNKDFFDDSVWDEWVTKNLFTATPGALDFLNYADQKGVKIFYISNRDQGENTYQIALDNLKSLGFPQIDNTHVIIQIETSNKEIAQQAISKEHNVVLYLGDNLNDFKRKYYVKDIEQRKTLMMEDRLLFGDKFIVFPNPTDGHWIRAIFGESEPPATDESRIKFKEAAIYSKWNK